MKIYYLCALVLIAAPVQARIGCMDNSHYLHERGDTKAYHYVLCNCPCRHYTHYEDKNRCPACQHYHDAEPLHTANRALYYENEKEALQALAEEQERIHKNPIAATLHALKISGAQLTQ